jgi:hypothetical protein
MILQKLIGNIYSVFIEVLLWITPIACAIVPSILLSEESFWKTLGMGILGLIAGIILDVILFAPVIILLNIRSSLKNIENK